MTKDELREALTKDSRTWARIVESEERARARLGETMRAARAAGIGPAEITRLIEHRLTEKTVMRETKDSRPGKQQG